MLGFDLAVIEQHVAFAPDHFPLLMQETLDGAAEIAVNDVVRARRVLRIETAQLFETTACAGFKAFQALDGSNVRSPSSNKH